MNKSIKILLVLIIIFIGLVLAAFVLGLTSDKKVTDPVIFETGEDSITIHSPADGGAPVLYKDGDGDSYILFSGTITSSEGTSPGCLVKVYSLSDQFLGEWCTHQTRSAGESYAFSVRVYVDDDEVTLTGENTLAAYWMRGDPREVTTPVTVNLPSDYADVVWGYIGNVQVYLPPEQIELLEGAKAEAGEQMQRSGIIEEVLSTPKDVVTAINIVLDLKDNPGAKVSKKVLKALTPIQAGYRTIATGGGFDDSIKRCLNSLHRIHFLSLGMYWNVFGKKS